MFLPELIYSDTKRIQEYLSMLKETKEINNQASKSALFKELYTLLKNENALKDLMEYDKNKTAHLKNGELIEIEGEFKQSPVELVLSSYIDMAQKFVPAMETVAFSNVQTKEINQVKAITDILKLEKTTVIIKPEHQISQEYKFLSTLQISNLEDQYDLDGELKIVGKIRKIHKKHQSIDLIRLLPGRIRMKKEQLLDLIPKENSEEFYYDIDEITEEAFSINGPAIEIIPIAIYR